MNTYFLTNSTPYQKIDLLKLPRLAFRLFWIFNVLLIIGLLSFLVFQVNTEISARFLIKEYQKRAAELTNQNKILAINSTQNGSLGKIVEIIASQDFEKIDKIHYIKVLDTQIVAR